MAIQYGMSEQTAAARTTIARMLGGRTRAASARRRVKKVARRRVKKAVKRAAGKKAAKFKKGSLAAKRHMAKLRKMVGRR